MTPRQPLLPAPYALSLRPGAVVSATWNNPILSVINTGNSFAIWGSNNANYPTLYGENMGVGPAVLGHSANGTGVSGQGTEGVRGAGFGMTSTGVFGEGMTGVRGQSLDGTGVSGSSANSIGVYGESITGTAGFFTSTYGAGVWANGVNGHALVTNRPSLIQGPNPKQIAVLRWYDAIDAASPYVVSVPCDPMDIAFDGDHLWVHETCTGDLYKIRASDGTVVFTTSVGTHNTHGLAYDGFYIWAPTPAGYLIRVRTSDGATMNIPLPVAFTPSSVAFDGRYVWVAGSSPNHVVRIRAGDPGISNTYTLPGGVTPDQLAFDGTYMWVTYSNMLNPGGIVRMLASNPVVSNTFEIGPSGGLVNSLAFDGANIWVANAVSNTITCLRAADGALLHTVALGAQPVHLVFDGYYIWATAWPSTGSNGLFKIRVQDGALVGAYVTNSTPWGIAFDGAHIWVVTESGTLNKY
jgi:sugar lactone lactonase YvrE